MAEESAVKVCVRVRPLVAREESAAPDSAEPVQLFWKADKKTIHQIDDGNSSGNSSKSFSFDRVFAAEESTNQLYQNIAKPLLVSTVGGYNGTIFAYGQTSSGKTFTMMGSERVPGVIPLAVEDVFQTIKNLPKKEFLLRVSYMEIYNETVTDLLVDSWKRKPLEVREGINKNIYVADLSEELVTSTAQALAWIRKGEKNRHYGKTKMNQRSSRSHTIFRMILESRERSDPASGENADGAIIVSHLNLVDLAGSERASQTGAEGTRFKEGCNINRSLFMLGQVIKKLTDENQKGFTNYRDSKLTRILQNSLGGNAKTVIICTITAASLDETLSTLQFASTAKKMKNDPHVTEVSDDGALLKRYRNEIVDLKRRLQEVSSVTQTTATEKEVLSQLIQEKDQLQREQQDRIRNLTKLLVTSSNLVPVHRVPKRRVTWGGKMLRLAHPSACDDDDSSSDHSFAESFQRKRKADRSYLVELNEDDEDFDSHWGIPEEPADDMEMSQNSVTVRSFGDSPRDFVSPGREHELSENSSNLQLKLETETLQREAAMRDVETLNGRVAELQLQLQIEAQQKQEALEKMQTTEQKLTQLEIQLESDTQQKLETSEKIQLEQRVAELEMQLQTAAQLEVGSLKEMQTDQRVAELEMSLETDARQELEPLQEIQTDQRVAELEMQLQTEAQQKLEVIQCLEFRVADLERQLEEQSRNEADKQMNRDFAETIQLCENLASEKDEVVAERDYLKQELGMFIEQTESLEKELAVLSKELKERKDLDEFKSLEEEFRNEQESEFKKEISSLKKVVDSYEVQNLELQTKLQTVSGELEKKIEFAEDLQKMSGKDLVQEVAKLRRSLDDAEGISRDTKKEWAFLRSENIALKEQNMNLTENHGKMEAELNSLQVHLEKEQSRYKKMQTDLQKELNIAFDENTKLTTLLDGKVPQNLIDSLQLERTVADLNRELTASNQAKEALGAQLEQLASLQTLPEKVDSLTGQLCNLTEELNDVKTQRDGLLSVRAEDQQESQKLRESLHTSQEEVLNIQAELGASALRETELEQQLDSLHSDLERSGAERSRLEASLQEMDGKATETRVLVQNLQEELQEQTQKHSDLEELLEQKESELKEHVQRLSQELECVQKEKETLQAAGAHTSAEELLSTVASLTEERDQLKLDMQENVDMMIENQEELRTALEKNRELIKQIKLLESAQTSTPDGLTSDIKSQLDELQVNMKTLTEELDGVRGERDGLLAEREVSVQSSKGTVEKITSLTEERDQLLEILEGLRLEKKQLKDEMEERMEMMQCEFQQQKTSKPQPWTEEQETQQHLQIQQLEEHLEIARKEVNQLKSNLQENTELMSETQEKLQASQGETKVLQEEISVLRSQTSELESKLSQGNDSCTTIQSLTEQLESLRAERDFLLSERTASSSQEEVEKLQHRLESLSQERDELQELLDGLRQERREFRSESEDRIQMLQAEMSETQEKLQASQGETKVLQEEISVLRSQTSELESKLSQGNDSCTTIQSLTEQLESLRAERDFLLSERTASSSQEEVEKLQHRLESLSQERDELQELLDGLRRERREFRSESEDRIQMLQAEIGELNVSLQTVTEQRRLLEDDLQNNIKEIQQLEEHLEIARKEVNQLKSNLQENTALMSETQEKLQASQGETKVLQEEISVLRSQTSELESKLSQGNDSCTTIQSLTEQLESLRAERDFLLSERTASSSQEEVEKLQHRLVSLSQERDELQELLDGLRQERQEFRSESEDRIQMLQAEIGELNVSLQTVTEQRRLLEDDLQNNIKEIQQLEEHLEIARKEVNQLKSNLQENTELMSETQEKLQASQGETKVLQEEISVLRSQTSELESKLSQGNDSCTTIQSLTEQLESLRAERDFLLSERTASISQEEVEKLQHRLVSLSQERDELQELLDGLRQERREFRSESEDRIQMLQAEIGELNVSLQTVTEQRRLLEDDLQNNMKELSSTQDLLKMVQEELCEQRNTNADWQHLNQEKESSLAEKVRTLEQKLESAEAERRALLSGKETNDQTVTEEKESNQRLQQSVKSLTEERDQLQDRLGRLGQEKLQLQEEQGDMMATLQTEVQQLEEQVKICKEKHAHAEAEAEASQQLLSEANATVSALKGQLNTLEQRREQCREMASALLQSSTRQLQESFGKFQQFIDTSSRYNSTPLDKSLRVQSFLKNSYLTTLPKPTMDAYDAVCQLGLQTTQNLMKMQEQLLVQSVGYKKMFEELVQKDLATFEEKRMQDLLQCRVQAPSYSVKDEDFAALWKHALNELEDKRQIYLQKIDCSLKKLRANMTSYLTQLRAEIHEREKFKQQLQAVVADQPAGFTELEDVLAQELARRSARMQSNNMPLQITIDEHNALFEELKQLDVQADFQLREEKSKNSTLLKALEGVPLKTELSLLKDNQHLALELQHSQENIKGLHVQIEQLEGERRKASNRVSNHKEATHLLQTELQDSRALVEEKDGTIQALERKLRESEKRVPPGAAEMEQLQNKLFKMELKLTSVVEENEKKIQRMNHLLSEKEQSLRKLKEVLRKSQQQGEDSVLQGEDVHARLTNPRGVLIKSSVVMEKTKLEEEVGHLKLKITELESLVSSQQAEISKWKNRAIKLKVKTKADLDKLSSTCTPTKRDFQMTAHPTDLMSPTKKFLLASKRAPDSPLKVLGSPLKVLGSPRNTLDSPTVSLTKSPKSSFFSSEGSSDLLSRSCPKQFFDNSGLGTLPGAAGGAGADGKEWLSPNEEMCKTQ
ncbi:centromere-associated protein E [Cololabis saira]|uniref:centromere-associated protein E n=1 Tax=Cololabis saira TaxID=129043 RepID=UPI002AD3A1BB|nr:centromere-associated protein E [Cololabis saira]